MTLIWYILINDTEKKFFASPPPNRIHSNFDAMLNDLSSGINKKLIKVITDESAVKGYSGERIVVLPIFKKSPVGKNVKKELANLFDDYQNTLFNKAFSAILQQLIES